MNYIEAIKAFISENEQEANDKAVVLDYIESFPHNILTRENQIAHITSSGIILNKTLDKMLMIHHNIYNTWAWTGGHADGDSDLLEVAVREAVEETGAAGITPLSDALASIDIVPVYGHMKKGKYVSSHLHLNTTYILIADEFAKLSVNEDETSGVAWVPVSQLSNYSNEPYLVEIYMKIIDKARRIKVQI